MFRGRDSVRFSTTANEASVRQAVRDGLASLGRVTIDRAGAIRIEPAERFRSGLAATTLAGTLRRELNEYDVFQEFEAKCTGAVNGTIRVEWMDIRYPFGVGMFLSTIERIGRVGSELQHLRAERHNTRHAIAAGSTRKVHGSWNAEPLGGIRNCKAVITTTGRHNAAFALFGCKLQKLVESTTRFE